MARLYLSTDTSAPSLTGTVGSMIALLDACLVNGYGSQTAAGWAKAFSGTNLAAYRAASGNRFYLRIDDTGAQEARWVGYETMSDVNTGTNPSPTTAQQSGGMFCRKSNSADSTSRPWALIASATWFIFLPYANDTVLATASTIAGMSGHMYWGDTISKKAGDAYNTVAIGQVTTGSNNCTLARQFSSSVSFTAAPGHFVFRPFTQVAGSAQLMKQTKGDNYSSTIIAGSGLPSYPSQIGGGIPIDDIELMENNGSGIFEPRAVMYGMWGAKVASPGAHLDTFSGTGDLSGKTFVLLNTANGVNGTRTAFETTSSL